jgi:hypothetical protein
MNRFFVFTARTVLPALFIVAAIGCTTELKESGFLKDYSQLEKDPDHAGTKIYIDEDIDFKKYDKFRLDPVIVYFHPDAKAEGVDPDELDELVTYFEEAVTKELSNSLKQTDQLGPGVLRMRLAITDVGKTTPAMNVLPQTKITGLGIGGASMEGEALDGATGEQLAAVIQSEKGSVLAVGAGLSKWGNAKEVMDRWAKRVSERLTKLRESE